MKIIVDAMGGDNAPQAIVQGALDAHKQHGVDILLVGRMAEILKALEACGEKNLPAGVEIRDASEVVEIEDDPATAFKVKKDSSLTVGMTLLIPTAAGRAVLCDCGANADCTPEYLLQFAYLGSYYAKRVCGVEHPKVGLLNIGAEEAKGDSLRHEAYPLLKAAGDAGRIHFIGNVEAHDAILGAADVIVADGFSGNILLKGVEGTAKFLMKELKEVFYTNGRTKLGAALVKNEISALKKQADPGEIGGTPFLGISKPVIKAHGGSNANAIKNAVLRAVEYAESGFIEDVEANIDYMRVQPAAEKI